VTEVAAPGALPGSVVAFGEDAFPVLLAGAGGVKRVPLAAAARWGKGRALVIAHDAFTAAGTLAQADSGRFLENALRWTSGARGKKTVRVGTLGTDLGAALTPRGFEVRRLDGAGWTSRLRDLDVLVLAGSNPSAEERAELAKFATAGGGLVASMCPWGWMQVTRATDLGTSGLQSLVLEAGLAFTEATVERTGGKGYVVMGAPGAAFHAERAVDLLVATGGKKATGPELLRPLVAQQAIAVLPSDERRLRARVKAFLRTVPSIWCPRNASRCPCRPPLDRFLLAAQIGELARAGVEDVRAHPPPRPSRASFLGREGGAHGRPVDLPVPGWHSTASTLLRAGGHGDRSHRLLARRGPGRAPACAADRLPPGHLWHLDAWLASLEITVERPFDGTGTTLACAFSGLCTCRARGRDRPRDVTIVGAVEAPLYVLGVTTKEAWAKSRRAPGPGPSSRRRR
jgi:hypothetical protein